MILLMRIRLLLLRLDRRRRLLMVVVMVVVMMVKVWRRWGRRRRRHEMRRRGRSDRMCERHLVRDAGRQVLHAAGRDVNAARRKGPCRLRAGVQGDPGCSASTARTDGDMVLGHADGQRIGCHCHRSGRSIGHSNLLHVNKEGALRALKRQHSQTSLSFLGGKQTRVGQSRDTTTAVFAVSQFL